MGMVAYCHVALMLLLGLGYLEYTVRQDWLHALSKEHLLNYVQEHYLRLPTLYQASLFPIYVVGLFLATVIVPGSYHLGVPLSDGRRIRFKINGFRLLCLLVTAGAVGHYTGYIPGTIVYDNFYAIFLSANVAAFLVSIYLYIVGTLSGEAKGRTFVENFVVGTQLMPFVFGQPLKLFWLKPSMMGWAVINLSFLAKHYELNGFVSTPMILYQAFTLAYIFDYFWFEERMTSTWDIIAERFGLMLVWGDIVFIPFVFSIQAWFLLEDTSSLPLWQVLGMVAVFILGYSIFRGSNSQKHEFKHDNKVKIWGKPAETIAGKLLVSGWWGLARHINYFGDLLLAVAFSLPCRFSTVLPWIYPIYLTLLLVHREVRDNRRCRQKYQKVCVLYSCVFFNFLNSLDLSNRIGKNTSSAFLTESFLISINCLSE
ncbi:Transmembrane 7 superfamily member 2, variant 2 [Balamuthia mandrillaris]